jgi:hypothetical protein
MDHGCTICVQRHHLRFKLYCVVFPIMSYAKSAGLEKQPYRFERDGFGGSAPRRTRTFNQLIKSQLLYH